MLKRKAEKQIIDWIDHSKKALLVSGVRQAGKTYIIRKCLEEKGCEYVEFNLIRQPEVVDILEGTTRIEDLIMRLSLFSGKELVPGETILFFDEIQRCKDIVTRVKFLVEYGRFRYIMSGSLLGVELTGLSSAPVGYMERLEMYPLDFEEFLQIYHISDAVMKILRKAYTERTPVDEVIHKRMLELFREYLVIGGMPAAVDLFRESGDINAVMREHQAIIDLYKLDFTQYEAEDRKLILTNTYELIPAELSEKNKRFKVADIDKNLRYERMVDSFVWLWKAGVAIPVFNVTEPAAPLLANKKNSLFKLFLSDVGLLTTMYGSVTKLKILNDDSDLNKGGIYENAVTTELVSKGIQPYYYNSKKHGEIDFVTEDGEGIVPIEVKSGKDYKRHSALTWFMGASAGEKTGEAITPEAPFGDSDDPGAEGQGKKIRTAFVLSNANVEVVGDIVYLPVYMLLFATREEVEFPALKREF